MSDGRAGIGSIMCIGRSDVLQHVADGLSLLRRQVPGAAHEEPASREGRGKEGWKGVGRGVGGLLDCVPLCMYVERLESRSCGLQPGEEDRSARSVSMDVL
jgi:hypothetical protein